MRLSDHMSRSGAILFRWRSFLPLVFVPFLVDAAIRGEQVEHFLGEPLGDLFELASIGLVILGQALRAYTVGHVPRGTSGRNVTGQLAEELNTTGIYSVVRNPLYLANCLMYLGVALFSQSLSAALVMVLVLLPYYERIIVAEEAFLSAKFGAAYDDWAARTPAFLPKLSGWVPPALPFSWRTVIRREQASVFGAVVALYLMELGLHHFEGEAEPMDAIWTWTLILATVLEIAAFLAKTRTRLLSVEGR
jgi:protein-S-isoprenylcysteine O-methyltransferase Ste14